MASSYDEFDVTGLRTYPLASRSSKVQTADFARPMTPGGAMRDWLQRLPRTLAAADLLRVAESIAAAKERRAGLIWGIGAHVIKTGVSPVLVDLMERGFITALAMNGAGVIHDFEVALAGATSEDVDQTLGPGTFGMAEETGTLLNQAIREAHAGGLGFGQGVSAFVAGLRPRFAELSLLASAHHLGVPVTVHVAIGTDIIHMHPSASGEAIGATSLRDFRYFTSSVSRLGGGVYLNCGSAVILPEVFLKAVALVRNQGNRLEGMTTVNLDFVRLYRPQTNVVTRPVAGTGGQGYSLVGPHELLIPLLAAAILDRVN